MKIEFPALESEPLIYFLFHSGVFVIALGTVFFVLGLWFGWLVWARYKRSHRHLLAEQERLQEEVIGLKKKLAEQVIRPPAKAPPTQVPALSGGLPELESALLMPDPMEPIQQVAEARLPMPALGKEQSIPEAFPIMPALAHQEGLGSSASGIRKGLSLAPLRVLPTKSPAQAQAPLVDPRPRHIPLLDEEQEEAGNGVEPFSFLMGPAPESASSGAGASPAVAAAAESETPKSGDPKPVVEEGGDSSPLKRQTREEVLSQGEK